MSQSEEMARMAQDLVAEEHSYPTVGRTDAPEEPPPPARPQRRRRPPSRFSPSPARRRAARSPHIGLPSGRSGDPDSCDSCVLLPLRRVVRPAADHATSTPPAGGSADSSRSRAPSTCRSASAGHRGSLQQGGHREVTCDFWPQAPNICPPGLSRLANVRHQPTGTTTPMVATPLPVAMEMAAGPADLPLLKAQKSEVRSIKYTKTGDKYTGGWMNNLPHGIGTYIYKKAHAIYQGDWIHGKRSGYGTFDAKSTSTGEYIRVYAGNWRNGEKYGYGTYYYSKDARYEGGWECDQRSGYGKMIYANGDVYEGEWRNDKYCGRGVLLCANKNRHIGSWKKGMKNGPGEFYYGDTGKIYTGIWSKDIAKRGTLDFCWRNAPNAQKPPMNEGKKYKRKQSSKEKEVHVSKRNSTCFKEKSQEPEERILFLKKEKL